MGNHQTLINYHAPLNFAYDLSEQLIGWGMLQHPGLGQIQLWKIKEINQPLLFSQHQSLLRQTFCETVPQIYFRCNTSHNLQNNQSINQSPFQNLLQLLPFLKIKKQ
ncbi:unnamed protein product [Paramecium sonneborni]|uniref:Uncharacterized protein n=1 Tax=Paramecium sonneborni TaxID=65129 RepID=A0A8S1MBU2_9CILI|nr:unnamed protein product [Paramecium sonneborni]